MSAYEIGPAALAHLPELTAVELEAARIFPEEYAPEKLRLLATPAAALAAAQREGRLFVAADTTGKPVGFALAGVMDGAAYLAELDVLPAHGRRGLGRRLIEAAVAWGEAGGFAALELATFRELPWNAPYYARLGFRELEPQELGPALSAVMERETAAGLDPARRVAMRRAIRPSASPSVR